MSKLAEKTPMVSSNPLAAFRKECESCFKDALEEVARKIPFSIQISNLAFERPPNLEFGQLASSLCFELAKHVGEGPPVLAKHLTETMKETDFPMIERVAAVGGYINFHANFPLFSTITIDSARHFNSEYGFEKADKCLKIIVEHTSVNPIHPIHIGQARNPMLGDAIVRVLKARGHDVRCHYYVDDVGRQSAVVAYGYEKLGRPSPKGKPDHFFGRIYTITSCLVEINRLKTWLKRAGSVSPSEESAKIRRDLDSWLSVAEELKEKDSEFFEKVSKSVGANEDLEELINKLNKKYEAGDERAKQLIREVSELCLQGFKESLSRVKVFYDSWDWESELVWTGRVRDILSSLKRTRYVFASGGVLEFDAERVAKESDLKKELELKADYEIPSLTLNRSDGTTLYSTRDIAYTLWKFERAEKVINVVGMEQRLAQLQLKIALHALNHSAHAENLIHFAHNLVTLPGYRMSARRGRYITFDEVMSEAVKRAFDEVSKRSPQLPQEEKKEIANFVGLGAVRYALIEVDPSKPVVFTWDRVLNLEKNSAPYIQYSHARACSILRKASRKPRKPAYNLLVERLEREIIIGLASFPDVFIEAAELLKPNLIADYSNGIADKFNRFYNAFPVLKTEPKGLSDARLGLVDAVRIVLRNALSLLGIVAPERM